MMEDTTLQQTSGNKAIFTEATLVPLVLLACWRGLFRSWFSPVLRVEILDLYTPEEGLKQLLPGKQIIVSSLLVLPESLIVIEVAVFGWIEHAVQCSV
jgi:hypothetical protein